MQALKDAINSKTVVVRYTRTPRGMYLGYAIYKDTYVFGGGKNMTIMIKNAKQNLYVRYKVPGAFIRMDYNPVDPTEFPSDKLSKQFKEKYWEHRPTDPNCRANKLVEIAKVKSAQAHNPAVDFAFHLTRYVGDSLVVYGCVEVARYNLENPPAQAVDTPEDQPDTPETSAPKADSYQARVGLLPARVDDSMDTVEDDD